MDEVPVIVKPATEYLFGPFIDALSSHPVLKSMFNMTKSFGEMGKTYGNLLTSNCIWLVSRSSFLHWRSSRMSSFLLAQCTSFLGCIGTLMKGSGLEVLVAAAFGGLTGIMNRKGWVRDILAYHMVSTALLDHYLQDNVNTFDEI